MILAAQRHRPPVGVPHIGAPIRIRLWADAFAVRAALGDLSAALAATLPRTAVNRTELVLAEVLNNIVEHAYRGGGGAVVLRLRQQGDMLLILIADHGLPLPGAVLLTNAQPPLRLVESGFGWPIIRSLALHLAYCRAGRWNRLRLRLSTKARPV